MSKISKTTKPKRRVTTRGRNVCSVENEAKARGAKADGQTVMQMKKVHRENLGPIGMKFAHKTKSEKSSHSSRRMRACEKWAADTCELGVRGIRKEFISEVKNFVPDGPQTAWESEKNYEKNRYEDVRLLDKTRVTLKKTPDNNDYIHASYVRLDDGTTFICAQGPLSNTVEHFWLMVIQEESKVIVQLCKTIEDGKEKCTEYFATDETEKVFGTVHVKTLEKQCNVVSLKKVLRTKIQVKSKNIVHEVVHILYAGWPDHCAAESPAICREVRTLVYKYFNKKPIIAHCSAGVGRTGTFVATEMAVQKLKKDELITMPEVARELREQRLGAIQTDQQYLFIFRMVIEVLVADDILSKDQSIINFIHDYDDLISRKRSERKTKSLKG